MSKNISQYESDDWKTANQLIGEGIKKCDFPKFMMYFFAWIMVENRLIRNAKVLENEIILYNIEGFIEEFEDFGLGINDYVIRNTKHKKTFVSTSRIPTSTFMFI